MNLQAPFPRKLDHSYGSVDTVTTQAIARAQIDRVAFTMLWYSTGERVLTAEEALREEYDSGLDAVDMEDNE